MTEKSLFSSHGIKDNHTRGKVADFLEYRLVGGSRLSVVSAYFTIYAQIPIPNASHVYELFFPEDLHARNIRLFDACAAAVFAPGHPVEAQLRSLQTLAVVRLIENQPPAPEPAPASEANQPL